MIWRLFHWLFGWDYVAWSNCVDVGISRVWVDGMGRLCYWRYLLCDFVDVIVEPNDVIWLTCPPEKYIKEKQ